MRFVIVTGISGAGKSTALKFLEDAQYFCVDNLPILLLEKFASMTLSMNSEEIRNVALGVDVRSGQQLGDLEEILKKMRKQGYQYEILFLDASDEVLIKRYKESRRNHPLAPDGRGGIGDSPRTQETGVFEKSSGLYHQYISYADTGIAKGDCTNFCGQSGFSKFSCVGGIFWIQIWNSQ